MTDEGALTVSMKGRSSSLDHASNVSRSEFELRISQHSKIFLQYLGGHDRTKTAGLPGGNELRRGSGKLAPR
jgi:hypothetical protein